MCEASTQIVMNLDNDHSKRVVMSFQTGPTHLFAFLNVCKINKTVVGEVMDVPFY